MSLVSTTCTMCTSVLQEDTSVTIYRAKECQCLCLHMYKCDATCYDFNKAHICKHIQRVHSLEDKKQTLTTSTLQECSDQEESMKGLDCELSYAESTFHQGKGMHYGKNL